MTTDDPRPADSPDTTPDPAPAEPTAAPAASSDAAPADVPAMPRIHMETSEGPLVFRLWPDAAPKTCDNFRQLIHDGFYDGLTFHRIIPTFIVQAGCPHGDGTGGPGYHIDAEFNDRPHDRGVVSMARTNDPNSAGSQFFICLSRENCAHLDGEYTAFAELSEGHETLDRLAATHLIYPELGTPSHPPQILHCYEVWDESTPAHESGSSTDSTA